MNDISEWIQTGLTVSAVIYFAALIVSVIALINTNVRAKKERVIAENRYNEQKRQYDERLRVESERREQDKKEANELIRISEQPYLVFKGFRVKESISRDQNVLALKFLNKGRGAAYSIVPDFNNNSSLDKDGNQLYKYGCVNDPIATVGECIEIDYIYYGEFKDSIIFELGVSFEDASGRKYKQTHKVKIFRSGEAYNLSYAIPEKIRE